MELEEFCVKCDDLSSHNNCDNPTADKVIALCNLCVDRGCFT